MRRKAFTLAEILVVLTIVAVIALILVPFLVSSFQKQKWLTTYKRTFSETYQALTLMALEEDCAKNISCTGAFTGSIKDSTEHFGKLFSSKMKLRSNCGLTKNGGNCFSHKINTLFKTNKENQQQAQNIKESLTTNPSGGGANLNWGNLDFPYTFVTQRGVSYALFSFGTECLKSNSIGEAEKYLDFYVRRNKDAKDDPQIPENDDDNPMLNLCGFIVIDVNAENLPNVWGKDVFGLWITDTKTLGVYPFGGASDKLFYEKCKKNSIPPNSIDGRGCASRIIEDSWVMEYF